MRVAIQPGEYSRLIARPEYSAKKREDESSYAWDHLIELFAGHILRGTSVFLWGKSFSASESEQGLRNMAAEARIHRRLLAQAFLGCLDKAVESEMPRFARVVLPDNTSADRSVAYIFLVMEYKADFFTEGYEQYRKARINTLHAYASNVLADNRNLKRAIGIGVDKPSAITKRTGGSEDLFFLEVREWTAEREEQALELKKSFEVMDHSRIKMSAMSADEYPAVDPGKSSGPLSRQQRRARERAERKKRRPR